MPITREYKTVNAKNGQAFKQRILDALYNSDFGMTPTQIARQVQMARTTANKYLEELEREGKLQVHPIGPSAVYEVKRRGNSLMFESLFHGAIRCAAFLTAGESPLKFQSVWQDLADKVTLPYEEDIPPVPGQPTPDYFDRLLHTTANILSEFGYFLERPKIEIIPSLGTQSPMSRLIRVRDAGILDASARFHYFFMAGLIEEKLRLRAGIPIVFRVTQDNEPQEHVIYFEVGLIQNYYLDICVIQNADTTKSIREILKIIKDLFALYLRFKVREYNLGEIPHIKLKFLDNRSWEEFLFFRAISYRKNKELFQKLNLRSKREWKPYQDWTDPPYLVIQFVTNVGFAIDDYVHSAIECFRVLGICIHYEKIPNGIRLNFMEKLDADSYFTNIASDEGISQLYHAFGIDSEEFLTGRKRIMIDTLEELKNLRVANQAHKRKWKSN